MAEKTVTVRIAATDNFSPTMQRYNQAMTQAEQTSRQAAGAARQTGGAFAELGTMMQGAIAGFALGGFAQMVGDLNALGGQVRAANASFEQLSGGSAAAAANLEMLRAGTNGVVDDLTLTQGATRLLLTGLAETGEEAARFTELAVKLGGAMGQDAASAIDNFNAALLNMSYERLDTLGISAGRVREQVNLLKEAGYSTEEAFRMAVLDQGTASLERLGSAAESGSTSLGRLQTRIQNMTQDLGEFTARGIEAGAQLLELYQIASQSNQVQVGGWLAGQILGATGNTLDQDTLTGRQGTRAAMVAVQERFNDVLRQTAGIYEQIAQYSEAQAEATALAAQRGQYGTIDQQWSSLGRAQDIAASGIIPGGNMPVGQVGMIMPDYLTSFQAAQIRGLADGVAEYAKQAKEGFDAGIVPESELQAMQALADRAEVFADEAERAADAYENMNLSQALGQGVQTGQQVLADVGGDVTGYLQSQGVGGDALQGLQNAFDLSTGAETELSLAYQNEVIPRIAEIYQQFGQEAAVAAAENYAEGLRAARLAGISDTALIDNMNAMLGLDASGKPIMQGGGAGAPAAPGGTQTERGEGGGAMASSFDPTSFMDSLTTAQEPVNAINTTFTEMGQTSIPSAVTALEPMQEAVSGVQATTDLIAAKLEEMASKTYNVTVKVKVDDPNGGLGIIARGGGDFSVSAARDNGGRPAGQDTRVNNQSLR